jgi:hypothetical protein
MKTKTKPTVTETPLSGLTIDSINIDRLPTRFGGLQTFLSVTVGGVKTQLVMIEPVSSKSFSLCADTLKRAIAGEPIE